jgi:hypothetical protein
MTTLVVWALLAVGPAGDASRPDFSGTWARVDAEPEAPSVASAGDLAFRSGGMGSGWGSPLTIRQDARALVVEYQQFSAYDLQPPIRFEYALDGSASTTSVMIGHAASELRSRADWRDRTLVVTTELAGPTTGSRVEVRQSLSLEAPDTLVVETTRSLEGAAPSVTRTTYARSQKPAASTGARD